MGKVNLNRLIDQPSQRVDVDDLRKVCFGCQSDGLSFIDGQYLSEISFGDEADRDDLAGRRCWREHEARVPPGEDPVVRVFGHGAVDRHIEAANNVRFRAVVAEQSPVGKDALRANLIR